ncbi:helix-turn-helix domain-containing protein [Leptospira noguchii]|uniref:helix-turn-helix domain-containing protein n=1 Tax=Leptospira noguchii TaxID=28182 RepID=UPI001F05EE29|nr:helix-turn-helix domain-containing protein [Leptospira noguchii]MCH1910475.1 helix-turn-helix domain-containing protein [Leptospira noguchii]MCH1910671.1 helix-turn-helix domain-containing protein [Leptospira noguchii]MCH1911035.1 helix-turn-helix domain-containing protein [Leptospira noguchii]MCH1913740.1 helix-turn-helix domain-containing protein [Leptospira noguchii]MCH1915673.1 helix-turn-helix domain-containing protein [Leptospira noguchii]
MAKKIKTSQKSNKQNIKQTVTGYTTEGSLFKTIPIQELKQKRSATLQTNPAIPKDPEDTMTPQQVAALLKRSVRRISYYRREGLLGKFWKFYDGTVLYSRIGVDEFFQSRFCDREES